MYKSLPLFLVLSVVMMSCEKEPPPPAQPQAPPEPTAQELRNELRTALSGLNQASGPEAYMAASGKDAAVNAFNQAKAKVSPRLNGAEALRLVAADVDNLISTARKNEAWMAAKGGIEIFKSLNPGSDRYSNLEQRVDIMLARPRVEVTGFVNAGNATEIFVRVTDEQPVVQVQNYSVREGEEFHDKDTGNGLRPILKIVRIIGNNQEVEIEYIPIEDTWRVPGPKQS